MAEGDVRLQSADPARPGWEACFRDPLAMRVAVRPSDVVPLLAEAERQATAGRWVVLVLSYEAAPAFDPAFVVHSAGDVPLAWALVYDRPAAPPAAPATAPAYAVSAWRPLVSHAQYAGAIDRIRSYIAAGDTYQVNYTFPLVAEFAGDACAWFADLCRAQGAAFCAHLDLGRHRLLSLSPELFVERHGERLLTRPMKGTAPRGRWLADDTALAGQLAACPKNRAENIMIVDLLRNDLGRVAVPGSVTVPRLFEVERLHTVLQMTSTVEACCRPDLGLVALLAALFPCGSITGAPKVRTMQIIHELEPFPRHVYTGAIGLVRPGGDATFSVAIRTVLLDTATGVARFGVGGGITHDSTAAGEYEECTLKARFLSDPPPPFDLLETLRLDSGLYVLRTRHLARLRESAAYFGFALRESEVNDALDAVCQAHPTGDWRVRLRLGPDGGVRVEAAPLPAAGDAPVRVGLAPWPVDTADRFLYHKTTNRGLYERAARARPDCADVLLWNERGELTESCIANLVVELDGRRWTPPRTCGLLAGTCRAELLEHGEVGERVLRRDDLARASALYLVNSVRGWRRAVLVT